jgi:hypothetical protein
MDYEPIINGSCYLAYYCLFNNYIRDYVISENTIGNPKNQFILLSRVPLEEWNNGYYRVFREPINLRKIKLEFGPVKIIIQNDYALCIPKIFWIRLFQRKWRKNRYYKSNKFLLKRQYYGNINRNKYYNGGFSK